ncbi:MAG TPA: PRK06851 family protein [Bacillota bacterium]|nr:PRK06851 family protein [Bacillota bacterium]
MAQAVSVKEVFPGGNTSVGFYSYYDYIISPDACRIMIIKGGPGVGKSSFMRRIAEAMAERGYDVELHHCSSDNNSLDGVVFPQIKVAMIDGTSPHIVDPKNPGAVDEIIHLGDYWDETGIRKYKSEILRVNLTVGKLFRRAYHFIRAAKAVHEDLESLTAVGFKPGKANLKTNALIKNIFGDLPVCGKPGFLRKLFASAITPDGFKNFLPTLIAPANRVFMVTGMAGSGKSTLIAKLAEGAVERGYDCEAYYCAFDPTKMEHLLIPDLGVAITTAVEPHRVEVEPAKTVVVNMDECLDSEVIAQHEPVMQENREIIAILFAKAIDLLHEAKMAHDQMEQYYIPNMDFTAISSLGARTLERILNYAQEQQSGEPV